MRQSMEKLRKNLFLPVFLPVLFLLGCHVPEEGKEEMEMVQVRYLELMREKLELTSTMPGRVSSPVLAEIRPRIDGIITERLFEEGSTVREGQTLYRIDPAPYEAAHAAAKASLAEADAHLAALALREKRQRLLVGQGVSRQELENTVSQHRQARARAARARADLKTAAINLSYTEIQAPVAGRIGASAVTVGALVTANQTGALAVIRQTDRVHIDMTQSSAEILRLRRARAWHGYPPGGNTVRLRLEDGSPYVPLIQRGGEENFPRWIRGEVLFSEGVVEQSTGTVRLRAVIDNPDGLLLPGMYVTALLEEGSVETALLLPQRSVMANADGGHSVLLLRREGDGGAFRVLRRAVTLDRAVGNRWLLRDGLKEGDLLVVEGLQKARPGTLVTGAPLSSEEGRR